MIPSLLVAAAYHLEQNGFFNVEKIKIEVSKEMPTHANFLPPLQKELTQDLKTFRGHSLWAISIKNLSQVLESKEWIKSYHVRRQWPQTLVVQVEPYEVELLLMGAKGELLPVIEQGKVLKPVLAKNSPDVVLAPSEEFKKNPELRKKAIEVLRELPTAGAFTRQDVSEITIQPKEGFWMTLAKSGAVVKMGDEQIALRAARVAKVVEYLETKQFDARVIDANLSKKVLVRLRKDP